MDMRHILCDAVQGRTFVRCLDATEHEQGTWSCQLRLAKVLSDVSSLVKLL